MRFLCPVMTARLLSLLTAFALLPLLAGCGGGKAKRPASVVAPADKPVLLAYDEVRAALSEDDMRKTRNAGDRLLKALEAKDVTPSLVKHVNAAKTISETPRIDTMRGAFKDICGALVDLYGDVEGFYIFDSPMIIDGRWLQTTDKPGNPYLGRALSTLGNPASPTQPPSEGIKPAGAKPAADAKGAPTPGEKK